MVIKTISIKDSVLGYHRQYNFAPNINLVTSKKNSQGKTTLLRFLLHALCYNIPATKGIYSKFAGYQTSIELDDSEVLKINRRNDLCEVYFKDGRKEEYILPYSQDEIHCALFGVESNLVLHNLLAIFYIDQEKGWTMLNRGKIIGNNRFNVEDYISGIVKKKDDTLKYEIERLGLEIKKCKSLLLISEFQDSDFTSDSRMANRGANDLAKRLTNLRYILSDKRFELNDIQKMRRDNKALIQVIEKSKLYINHNGEKIAVKRENIENFNTNDEYLKHVELQIKHDIDIYQDELNKIEYELKQRSRLFDFKSIIDEASHDVSKIDIDRAIVEGNLKTLAKQQRRLSSERKQRLIKESCMTRLYSLIMDYAEYMDVRKYIHNEKEDFVLTTDLKGYSGTILAQLALAFKLAYMKILEEEYGIILPIIIDSPRTSEMTEESVSRMFGLLNESFSNHQVIIASVYDNLPLNINRIVLSGHVIG